MTDFPQFRTSDGVLTVLCDGTDCLPLDMLIDLDRTAAAAYLKQARNGIVEIPINAFLYQTGRRNILIDGGGAGLSPGLGALSNHLAELEVDPAQIDTVFCTHLHPDHIGGFLRDGAPNFSNATLKLHTAEPVFWQNPALRNSAPPQFQTIIDGARDVLDAYSDQIETFSTGAEIAPGATAVHLPGHTPGHCGLDFGTILVWADIVHMAEIQLALPGTSIVFDADPDGAATTRKHLLERVCDTDLHIAGGHLPGIGKIHRASTGYSFRPV